MTRAACATTAILIAVLWTASPVAAGPATVSSPADAEPARAASIPGERGTALADARQARPRLAAHRAVYRISLASAQIGSGIIGARGAMLYQFDETCAGWTVENRVYLLMQYDEGEEVETSWELASFEAKSGRSYRFGVRHSRNGDLVEDIRGSAALAPAAGGRKDRGRDGRPARPGGVAKFTQPQPFTVRLPAGAMFPTQHLLALLAAAGQGRHHVNKVVFDGSSLDNPFVINAVIEKPEQVRNAEAKGTALDALAASRSWRMHLAFFPAANKEPLPEYEIVVRYREDGIAEEIRQDFGNFVLDLLPQQVEILAAPDC